jgi:hypothetical protein
VSTVDEQAVATVTRVAESCNGVLNGSLVSAILHGSLTLGDFKPGRSDLDLILVVERSVTAETAEALVEVVRTAELSPAGGLDLLVVTRAVARDAADNPSRELSVGRFGGSDDDLEIEGPADDVSDLLQELSMARVTGRALLGADPRDVVGEVPAALVRANGTGWLRTWLGRVDDEKNAVFMVLTACRMWLFACEGRHSSKSDAARWVLDRDPSLEPVRQALTQRAGGPTARIAPDDVRRVLVEALRDSDVPPG